MVAINKLKDPPTWLKVGTTLEKPPTSTHGVVKKYLLENIYGKCTMVYDGYYVIRKSEDYVYGKWGYKLLGIWKGYYRVKKYVWWNMFIGDNVYL